MYKAQIHASTQEFYENFNVILTQCIHFEIVIKSEMMLFAITDIIVRKFSVITFYKFVKFEYLLGLTDPFRLVSACSIKSAFTLSIWLLQAAQIKGV